MFRKLFACSRPPAGTGRLIREWTGCAPGIFARLLEPCGRHQRRLGRPQRYPAWVELLVTLMKLRRDLPYRFIETLTGIDAVTASRMVRRTLARLSDVTQPAPWPPPRHFIVDTTTCRVGTSKRSFWSGHKHHAGLKAQVLCDERRRIHHVSAAWPAGQHDKTIWNCTLGEIGNWLDRPVLADKAYAGARLERVLLFRPVKRQERAYRENREKVKATNRERAQRRVRIEHVMASLKRFRVLRDRFPLALRLLSPCLHVIALIHNLELMARNGDLDVD